MLGRTKLYIRFKIIYELKKSKILIENNIIFDIVYYL